tara:strand:+ start:6150 stop:7211 length:1062 start_codon:yes stop_codon:yes gene_type:complete
MNNTKQIFKDYSSPSTDPIIDTGPYTDEVDYVMKPLTQATRIENNTTIDKQDKKDLYNKYNEAVARYNEVKLMVKKNPKVPNINTIVAQRDRAYRELEPDTHVPFSVVVNTRQPTPIIVPVNVPITEIIAPVPVLKDKKREDRLKIEVKSSSQNVHDHNVNDNLSNRYRKLKSNIPPDSDDLYAEMLRFIDKHDHKGKITDGFKIGMGISRFNNDKEDMIWSTVWRRIHSPENAENIDSLKNSLRDAIKDCTENGHLVCTTGRVTRVLDSLTLLDKNDEISKPIRTDDIERKEVYDQAHTILHRELDKMGEKFKKDYESGEMDNTDAFDERVKESIKKEVGTSKYLNDALAAI